MLHSIISNSSTHFPSTVGGKAFNILKLDEFKFLTPPSVIIDNDIIYELLTDEMKFNLILDSIINRLKENNIENFSIRSSPVYSMPGMMDTILDVNINDLQKLKDSILTIVNSYYNKRAILYRKIKNIPEILPGIIIQKMVYGDKNDKSGTGILFTRTSNGKLEPNGEYIPNAKGDVLVSNETESNDLTKLLSDPTYKYCFDLYVTKLEQYFKAPQEVEFTIEDGEVYFLQTRKLQFNNLVYLHILNNMLNNGTLTPVEFNNELTDFVKDKTFEWIDPIQYDEIDGVPFLPVNVVSGGIKRGIVTRDVNNLNKNSILIKDKILNEDLQLLNKIGGLITTEGNITSHPSILCRNLSLPYVIIEKELLVHIVDGEVITLDAYNGAVTNKDVNIEVLNTDMLKNFLK